MLEAKCDGDKYEMVTKMIRQSFFAWIYYYNFSDSIGDVKEKGDLQSKVDGMKEC